MDISGYRWSGGGGTKAHSHLVPTLLSELSLISSHSGNSNDLRAFDLGCGNGSVAGYISSLGWSVSGVDPSSEGIEQASIYHPECNLQQGSAYDDLAAKFGELAP